LMNVNVHPRLLPREEVEAVPSSTKDRGTHRIILPHAAPSLARPQRPNVPDQRRRGAPAAAFGRSVGVLRSATLDTLGSHAPFAVLSARSDNLLSRHDHTDPARVG
jgi:hypothetical protein